jgi:hypothetical protein
MVMSPWPARNGHQGVAVRSFDLLVNASFGIPATIPESPNTYVIYSRTKEDSYITAGTHRFYVYAARPPTLMAVANGKSIIRCVSHRAF